jgi:regulator of replication initiation timing
MIPHSLVLAAVAAATLAACSGGMLGTRPAAGPEAPNLQAQLFALEASQNENRRVMGQVLAQSAQLRDDLAIAVNEGRALQQRVDTLERRLAQAQAQPQQAAEPMPASEPRRTPLAARMPDSGARQEPLRLSASVRAADGWQSLYANREDRSQKVRIRRASAGAPARIRLAATGAGEAPDGPPHPTWDLSGKGAEKWLRIGCGQEISARAEDEADFEVLVRADQQPDLCSRRSMGTE